MASNSIPLIDKLGTIIGYFTPGGSINAGKPAAQAAGKVEQSGVGSLLSGGTREDVIRFAEGVIGILLIVVGVAKLAEDSPVARTATKIGLMG